MLACPCMPECVSVCVGQTKAIQPRWPDPHGPTHIARLTLYDPQRPKHMTWPSWPDSDELTLMIRPI